MNTKKKQVIEAIKTLTEVIKVCSGDQQTIAVANTKIRELIVEL